MTTLTEEDAWDYYARGLHALKDGGGHAPTVAEKFGSRGLAALIPFDEMVAAIVDLMPGSDKKATRKKRTKRIAAAMHKGQAHRTGTLLDDESLERKGRVNDEVERIRIRKEAAALVAEEDAGDDSGLPDYADVAAFIEKGVERRVPDAGGVRNDGVRLAYRGAVNGLVGPPESGKTLVAIAQACDELRIGDAL